jgi:hypothetical protein
VHRRGQHSHEVRERWAESVIERARSHAVRNLSKFRNRDAELRNRSVERIRNNIIRRSGPLEDAERHPEGYETLLCSVVEVTFQALAFLVTGTHNPFP